MIEIITATPEMIRSLGNSKVSVRAIAAVEDGNILGIAGVRYIENYQMIFTRINNELKKNPRIILAGWKILNEILNDKKLPTYAFCDFTIPKAPSFLLHFGFEPIGNNQWIRRT